MTGHDVEFIVYELPPSRFQIARHLYREIWFDAAFVGATFEGNHQGRLFVDDPEHPTAAMITNAFEYYVAGSPKSQSLRRFIRDAPAEARVFSELYGYAPANVAWSLAILADHDEDLVVVPRRGFRWVDSLNARAALQSWRELVPGVSIRRIDEALALRVKRELQEDVGHFWGGTDQFLSKSFGYCTMVEGAPASIAHAIGIGQREANIAVFTMPEYRRNGHAARASTAYIDHCLRMGLVPTWDSDSDNPRSADLARRLGFREVPPFSQLSPKRGTKVPESHGLWTSSQLVDGVIAWKRCVTIHDPNVT